jgi:hypothetical protein
MNLEFLPEAQAEFVDAAEYYESKESGLGKRFRDEVGKSARRFFNIPHSGVSV